MKKKKNSDKYQIQQRSLLELDNSISPTDIIKEDGSHLMPKKCHVGAFQAPVNPCFLLVRKSSLELEIS